MAAWIIGMALLNGALGFAAAFGLGRRHWKRCARARDPAPADVPSEAAEVAESPAAVLDAILPPGVEIAADLSDE